MPLGRAGIGNHCALLSSVWDNVRVRRALLWLVLATFVGAGLGGVGAYVFPRDSWSLGRVEATPWMRVEVDRTAGTALVAYQGGWCSRFDHAQIATRGRYFVITVFERTRRLAKNDGCPLIGVPRTATVSLSAPIGTRPVVDGACTRSAAHSDVLCRTDDPPCVLVDHAANCLPSARLGPGGRLLRPLSASLNRP
jgi:hypothetical protein